MVARVREAAPGDNVTDQTRVEALIACGLTFKAQEEAAEVAKSARSAHSNEIKKWKKRGINTEALKRAVKDRFMDPAEVIAEEHEYIRMRALQNMPSIQQDLMAMWQEIDLSDDRKAEIERQRWRDDGAFCARQGKPREDNPHHQGTEAHQQWDLGWLNDQERIAKAMGAGEQPAVTKPSRERPARRTKAPQADKPATPPAAVVNGARPRRRRGAAAVH